MSRGCHHKEIDCGCKRKKEYSLLDCVNNRWKLIKLIDEVINMESDVFDDLYKRLKWAIRKTECCPKDEMVTSFEEEFEKLKDGL